MANKQIFSYGNNGKRKIGHSKFDMGFEHLMSANFGGLHPAAVYETLPDDYWDISDNTVTLLKPLTAPAFTRINQNFYGAYVRNQQIWKYWNDYISNGTAFGDVYGNNVTNQSLKNAWDVPSIPTPFLQVIQKIGAGNAAPLFVVNISGDNTNTNSLVGYLLHFVTFINVTAGSVYRVTDAIYAVLMAHDPAVTGPIYHGIQTSQLWKYAFDCFYTKDSSGKHYFQFHFYCSLRQISTFKSLFGFSTVMSSDTPPSSVGSNSSDAYAYNSAQNFVYRFFCDDVSAEPSTSTSAFLIEKTNYIGVDSEVIKSLDYHPRLVDSTVDKFLTSGFGIVYQCLQSPFWGFRYNHFSAFTSSAASSFLEPANAGLSSFNSNTDFYWHIDTAWFGYPAVVGTHVDLRPLFESWSLEFGYLGVTTQDWKQCLDDFGSSISNQSNISFTYSSSGSISQVCGGFGSGSIINYNQGNITYQSLCDLRIPCSCINVPSGFDYNGPLFSRDSKALGYDITSMITYLCNNSLILQDEMGLKVDPLSSRPFSHYRFELTNALPFFAYDKIWNDNFRNSVVSSPCLDFRESNSVIYANADFYANFVYSPRYIAPSVLPPRYANKTASDFDPNGWTLEIVAFPRNSIGDKIHTHLPIKSFYQVFSVLTGHCLDFIFQNLSNTDLNVYDYYLPSYYNGLLHLKYQNFNKDYFTSALLDPMSGANQVFVGSTINELRENEAKQHWWERTAMYRSIKNWFQGTYGITPIELPEDSRITGTDHIDVQIGEVIQTSGSTPESPQGTRTGLGGSRGSGSLCHGHANEHGWIFILMSHTIESQYSQVYDKMYDVKDSFLDYPTVDFAGIGNESILQKEVNYTTVPTTLYDAHWHDFSAADTGFSFLPVGRDSRISYDGTSNPKRIFNKLSVLMGRYNIAKNAGTSLDNTFGFTPRYSSYKFKFDQVSGQFRHELNFWHTFKRYLTMPILCHEFVNWEMAADDDDINRIFAVSDDFLDDKFTIDCFINASVDRALPFVCVPTSK